MTFKRADILLPKFSKDAEKMKRDHLLEAKEEAYKLKVEAEKDIKERKSELKEMEERLLTRENNIDRRDQTIQNREVQLEQKEQNLIEKQNEIQAEQVKIEGIKKAGVINTAILDLVESKIKVGMTTDEINSIVHNFTILNNAIIYL